MDEIIGSMVGRYKIIGELGHGGMSVVYKAQDTVLERFVAIKMILPGRQQSDKFLKRFQREARTLAQLSHPNIVKVLDFGEFGGTPYLVMEYISGGTLSGRMGRPYSAKEAAALLAPVARALHSAHQHKVIHRDVKPGNILINESGQTSLSDFGIVKLIDAEEGQSLTGTGQILGTPSYMAPEQIKGQHIDGRADIYALGIIFFELLTGRKPYVANTPIEVTLKHLNEPIPRPRQYVRDLPPESDQVILKTMAKNPEDRFPTMEAFARELERMAEGPTRAGGKAPIRVTEPPRPKDAGKAGKKVSKPAAIAGGVIGLVVLAAVILAVVFSQKPAAIPTQVSALAAATAQETAVVTATEEAAVIAPSSTATVRPTSTEAPPPTATLEPTATLVALPDNMIQAENADRVVELIRLEKISVIQILWSPTGDWIVDAGARALSIIDADTLKVTASINLGNEIPKAIAVTADAKRIFVLLASSIKVFDLETRDEIKTIGIQGGANSMAVTQDGTRIALGMLDNKMILLDSESGSVLRSLRSNYGGWSVAFSPDGKYVAAGTSQGVLMWETETGTWLPVDSKQTDLIKTLVFSHDGKKMSGGSRDAFYVWDVETGKELNRFSGTFGDVNTISFSPDDQLLLSGSADFIVRLWDLQSATEIMKYKSHTSTVFSTAFSPEGEYFVSGANEGVIRKWGVP